MSTMTVREIIDSARVRHWSFAETQMGDGAAMLFLSQRLRTHLAVHGAKIEGLVNTTLEYDVGTVNGVLVGSVGGVPVYLTTYQDGWPVLFDGGGIPYIDDTAPPIATDPFGEHGNTPGFPLPNDFVRFIAVALIYNTGPGMPIPCDVVPEPQRFTTSPGRNPAAFVSGNRLVPILPLNSNNSGNRWFNVTAIQMSYVALPTLTTLDQTLALPAVLSEALIADLAFAFAQQSKSCSPAERSGFNEEKVSASSLVGTAAVGMLQTPIDRRVQYRG